MDQPTTTTRRAFLARSLAAGAWSSLHAGRHDRPHDETATTRGPQFAARARRVLHVCLCGGLSHVDSFDPKPALARWHGAAMPTSERPDTFFGKVGRLRRPDWEFRPRGQSGLEISGLFPSLAELADELTIVRSMFAETSNHTPATFQENSGFRLNGFPVLGAWLSHALGAEARDLPAYVVIPDARGLPAGGPINWTNGFLPAEHQGVVLSSSGTPIHDLFPARPIPADEERATRALLRRQNEAHAAARADASLRARMLAHELAERMQATVPELADLSREPAWATASYGLDDEPCASFARSCLLARRLLERGVRMVQLFSGGAFGSPRINWDGHEDVRENHGREAARIDRPLAALLRDLRARGMLDDTLVLFTTEFGRTPFCESGDDELGPGRDHNPHGFSIWLAGAGLRPGIAYGSTDEFGYRAVERRVHWNDLHATVLHLCGLDHERLVYYHDGIRRRLTNVGGRVLFDLLA
ncbi:MAG: DUF1501 domain-containing protein [Planctomycetes bacterium]|nr:DUF1501 domain-containing protein [Planctomycetota bacterium]